MWGIETYFPAVVCRMNRDFQGDTVPLGLIYAHWPSHGQLIEHPCYLACMIHEDSHRFRQAMICTKSSSPSPPGYVRHDSAQVVTCKALDCYEERRRFSAQKFTYIMSVLEPCESISTQIEVS